MKPSDNQNRKEDTIDLTGRRSNPDKSDGSPAEQRMFVDLSSDEENGESSGFRKRRKIDSGSIKSSEQRTAPGSHPRPPDEAAPSAASSGILGLNRRQMEAERLARLNVSPPPRRRTDSVDPHPLTTTTPTSHPTGIEYPRGILKKTWAFRYDREEDIKIEEVLQKRDLKIAVLSAFEFDVQWLLTKIDTDSTKVVLVMQAKDAATRAQYAAETEHLKFLKLCFPPMDGLINCMHSKLQLLFYDQYLRVVIPSGNLTTYDWGETGVMENSVFLIDLPKLPKKSEDDYQKSRTYFYDELIYFLQAMRLQTDMIDAVSRFDFSGTEDLAFVHTIGGHHTGNSWRRTGYCGLGEAVRKLNLGTKESIDVDYVASSIGALTRDFLKTIYHAAQGQDSLIEYNERYNKPPKPKDQGSTSSNPTVADRKLAKLLRGHFRAYYPTSMTVAASRGGTGAGGTICFNSGYWKRPNFPQDLFRDCQSRRTGLLMHNKMLFARSSKPLGTTPREKAVKAWVYHGSANLSSSAWGTLFKDTSTKKPKLSCRNWECGILIPVSANRGILEASDHRDEEVPPITIYRGVAPVPMEVPGEALERAGTPWFLRERDLW